MKEVRISPECQNVLIFLNDFEFVIKNRETQRFIIDQNSSTYSIKKARIFQSWRNFENRYKTFVAQSDNYDRIIFNDGTCTRNYNSIGDLSTDGSRPASIKINGEDHWFYLEGFKENKTLYPYKKEIKGSKFELKPRVCGYDVVSVTDEEKVTSWLSWEKNAWHYNFKNFPMNYFERISEETAKVFKGVKKDILTGKLKFRVFKVNRDLDNSLSKPYISPDYYLSIEPDTKNNLLYVILEDKSKAVLLYQEGKLKYWPMTNQGLYQEYKYKDGYLICYRHNNSIDILDEQGLSLTSFWKKVELKVNLINYENYFGQLKQCEFHEIRKEYELSAQEFRSYLNKPIDKADIISKFNHWPEEKDLPNLDCETELIQFASITNNLKEYSSNEYSYRGILKVTNDKRGQKIDKNEPVIFICPKKNLLVKAIYKAERGKNIIFECLEKQKSDLSKRNLVATNYFTRIDLLMGSFKDSIEIILNKLCSNQNNIVISKISTFSEKKFVNTKTNDLDDKSIETNMVEKILENDIIKVYNDLSNYNFDENKVYKALTVLFEERLNQKEKGISYFDKIKESLRTEPDYNNVLKTIYSKLDERDNFEFNYKYNLFTRFENYSPKDAIIKAGNIVKVNDINFINWIESLLKPSNPDIDTLEIIKMICSNKENLLEDNLPQKADNIIDNVKIKTKNQKNDFFNKFKLKIDEKEYKKGDILPRNIISIYQRIFFKRKLGAIFIKITENEISTRNTKNEYNVYGVGGEMMVFLEGNENSRIKSQKYPIIFVKKDQDGNYRYYDLVSYKDHHIEKTEKGEKILFNLKKI